MVSIMPGIQVPPDAKITGVVGNPAKKPPYPTASLPALIPPVIAFEEVMVRFPVTLEIP